MKKTTENRSTGVSSFLAKTTTRRSLRVHNESLPFGGYRLRECRMTCVVKRRTETGKLMMENKKRRPAK
ncbi:hypothetical protein AB6A40_004115 [Gnathostoma spinigerum]|uniref:Ribosomal protein L34 n=1 Tax=Gnathostoma spinigerum TaxID=75299 RepID=A0ABD6ECM2_9BILA